ncbi:MAG: phenylalanine--tRNA ligase subunit beta [Phycisphaeraceae bacterium]|nr:phenylalanine--tRNA ligase subunit beta [Phycisphaerales bacterium]MCB9859510.1 phenylalanine--tRNA ligase subunit beta [Phycisphaeraceae bacterium]
MDISLHWLNSLLSSPVTANEADDILTHAGFPIEGTTPITDGLASGDVMMDVEVTSNRGDVLCHLGCAREIAACTGRTLHLPSFDAPPVSGQAGDVLTLRNEIHDDCPLFTISIIENVKVGPSPDWLVKLLEAVGQRSISNVVDVTNWLNMGMGFPAHVFDLDTFTDKQMIIRYARKGETLKMLDDQTRTLAGHEMVICDTQRPHSLAGVMGGFDSQVTEKTTRVALEIATWRPAAVRASARQHNLRTDASHRYERYVDARPLAKISELGRALIVHVAGGSIREGILSDGAPLKQLLRVDLRLERASAVLGFDVDRTKVENAFHAMEIETTTNDSGVLTCTVPAHRSEDLKREIDLIEEIGRVLGINRVPMLDRMPVRVKGPQASERAMQILGNTLTGLGFYETVTFSFITPKEAKPWMCEGIGLANVDENRRPGTPTLRPSILPSLLACRKLNRDARNNVPGGIRLFETSAVFGEDEKTHTSIENRNLGMLIDVPDVAPGKQPKHAHLQHGVRLMRGAIDTIVRALGGINATIDIVQINEKDEHPQKAWLKGSCASVLLNGIHCGTFGLLTPEALKQYDIDTPVVAAELSLNALIDLFPSPSRAHALPQFPTVERDVSLIVDEPTPWATIESIVNNNLPEWLESSSFVGTFRGGPIGDGKKSVTMRFVFRHPERTLTREEIDPKVDALIDVFSRRAGASVRTV